MTASFVILSYQDCPALFSSETKFHHQSSSRPPLLLLLLLGYLEVHPTPVYPGLALLDVLHPELCRAGAELEVSPGPELCLVAPPLSQVPGAVPGVVTAIQDERENQ